MKFQIFTENEWVYPDTQITNPLIAYIWKQQKCKYQFQVLTDIQVEEGHSVTFDWRGKKEESLNLYHTN